jgi:vitamin K-dependent gamma-carboxylase
VCFHLLNVWFFRIGIFPWFSIAMTTVFLEPDWPVRLWNRLTRKRHLTTSELPTTPPMTPLNPHQHRVLTFVGLYIAIQVLLPLRHWIYPGDVAWTEEGHQFSWRMKLRDKEGDATFIVTNPATGETWHESADAYLEPWQTRKMVNRPELIRQFTHHLAALKSAEVGTTVEVRVQSIVRLNHREPGVMIDPQIDLSKEPHRIGPAKWIVRQPIPRRPSGGG